MMTMSSESRRIMQIIQDSRVDIYRILGELGANNPYIFGSVAKGEAVPGSDIDIIFDFIDPDTRPLRQFAIKEELQNLIGIKVDAFEKNYFYKRFGKINAKELIRL